MSAMQAEARQHLIDEYLHKVEFASLEELAQQVDASVSTVRRDLTALESKGAIRRTHGGARLIDSRSDEFTFSTRDTHQLDAKEAIGRACAELIKPNQTVIIDAGTTAYHVARHLENKTLHIVTNSLPVANHFASSQRVEVIVSGGVIYPRVGVLVGPIAVEAFSKIRADIAIMSCGGIATDGVTNSHGLLIEIQRAMLQAARRIIFCVDHTKFGRQSISQFCDLNVIDSLITDQTPPPEMLIALRNAEVEVIVAGPTGPEIVQPEKPLGQSDPAETPAQVGSVEETQPAFSAPDRFVD
jgi:DeoR family transcriptional regulator, fructose operon transcriptional repressor